MADVTDSDLLGEFADRRSEAAFGKLARRHIALVYSVAMRYVGNVPDAQDVAQAVFVILARKAARLRGRATLTGWLYETTRLTASQVLRSRIRRQLREQEAFMQSTLEQSGGGNVWAQIAPHLEAAMGRLRERDRTLLALRFYENKTGAEAAGMLGIQEEAAHKRTARALEKLRKFFANHGVNSTTAVLAETISANSVQAAPAALAKAVTAVALAKGTAASATTLTLIKGTLKIMAWTKMKTVIVVGVGILLTAGSATVVMTKMESPPMDAYLQDPELNGVLNAPPMVAVQPTHFPRANLNRAIVGKTVGTREIGRNIPLSDTFLKAYGLDNLSRMVFPEELQRIKVDYLVTVPDHPRERFQAEIKRKFGWTAHFETRDTDVFLLRVKHANAPGLTTADNSSMEEWFAKHPQNEGIHRHNITVSKFAELVEDLVQKPVIDQTDLTGNYDFITKPFGPSDLNQVFLDQLGLELVPTNMPIEMLVVERAP